jgi:hypothetical protein
VTGGNGAGSTPTRVEDRGTSWLDASGSDHEIVLSTRVRLAAESGDGSSPGEPRPDADKSTR